MVVLIGYPMYQYGYQEGVRDSSVDLSLEIALLEGYRTSHVDVASSEFALEYYHSTLSQEQRRIAEYTEIIKSLREVSR